MLLLLRLLTVSQPFSDAGASHLLLHPLVHVRIFDRVGDCFRGDDVDDERLKLVEVVLRSLLVDALGPFDCFDAAYDGVACWISRCRSVHILNRYNVELYAGRADLCEELADGGQALFPASKSVESVL